MQVPRAQWILRACKQAIGRNGQASQIAQQLQKDDRSIQELLEILIFLRDFTWSN